MVSGLPQIQQPAKACEGCVIRKQPRKVFKTFAPKRAKKVLEVVHLDVCGLLDKPSLGGSGYFLTFVDEFSRKIWVYLLKEKGDVFSMFEKLCA